jgi:hypothetical protein
MMYCTYQTMLEFGILILKCIVILHSINVYAFGEDNGRYFYQKEEIWLNIRIRSLTCRHVVYSKCKHVISQEKLGCEKTKRTKYSRIKGVE